MIAVGPMLGRTLEALTGRDATVLYATTVLPLDATALATLAAPAPEIVVVEPFYEGTLAAQVLDAVSHRPTRILSLAVPRRLIDGYGTIEQHDAALARHAQDQGADSGFPRSIGTLSVP